MDEKSLHAVGRKIFQMEEAKMMGPGDVNESRHSLPVGVARNDERVDRKNKASSNCRFYFCWDPSGREMVERS